MMPRFSPIAIAGWFMFGPIAVGILIPGPATSINVVGTSQTRPIASAQPSTIGSNLDNLPMPDPALAKLSALVWRHGEKPSQQTTTVNKSGVQTDVVSLTKAANAILGTTTEPAIQPPLKMAQADQPPAQTSRMLLVANSGVYVHASPDGQSSRLFVLQPGESVEVAATQASWVEVRTASGETGWAYSKLLLPVSVN